MNRLYAFAATVAIGSMGYMAQAQEYTVLEDMTSKIVNADFKADSPITQLVTTYDYDMEVNGTSFYGQQAVTGWTAVTPSTNTMESQKDENGSWIAREDGSNARAAGIFAFYDENAGADAAGLLGSTSLYPPTIVEGHAGPGLGLLAVWGAELQYTQDITLPAGAYAVVTSVCNTAGDAEMTCLNGFIAEDGASYLSKTTRFPVDAYTWTDDVVMFILDKDTKGKLSLGYKAGGNGSAASHHLYIDGVKLYKIDPAPIIKEQVDAAKESLLAVITEGQAIGVDTKAAQAVYDNPNATLADVEAAIKSQKEINAAGVTDLSAFFITNSHFTMDTPIEGGITTYDYDRTKNEVNWYGMQPVHGWTANRPAATLEENPLDKNTNVNNGQASGVYGIGSGAWLGNMSYVVPNEMSNGETTGNVLGFVGAWSSVAQYTQHVSIPAGAYTLTISYYNTGGDKEIAENLMGFIADDGTKYLSDTKTFKVGSWERMTIKFTLDKATSGNFSVGYAAANTGSGNMPHFFIDGIALNYVGETALDPSLFALQAAVTSGQELLENNFYTELKESFAALVEKGNDLVMSQSADADANTVAANDINKMMDEVKANIDAYDKLGDFAEGDLQAALTKYENVSSIFARLEELNDEVSMTALQEYTWTTEQINEAIASLSTIITDETKKLWDAAVESGEPLDADLDITMLLSGLSFESNANDWKSDNGNVTVANSCAEIWNASGSIKATRTLTEMPAGTYTITTRAFYRTATNTTNYENYQAEKAEKAFVWAGHNKTALSNVVELLVPETKDGYADLGEGVGFVPNGRPAAQKIFTDDSYAGVVERKVKTVLAADGDLSFGICGEDFEGDSWIVWYGFEIAYNAIDEDVAAEEAENLKNEIRAYMEENTDYITVPVNDKVAATLEGSDLAAIAAAYDELKENVAAVTEIIEVNEALTNSLENFSETASAETVKAVEDAIAKYEGYTDMTTSDVKELTEEMRKLVYAIRIPAGFGDATDANSVDFTQVIENPSFETGDTSGWTYNTAASGDTGAKDNSNATYTIDNADGSYVFNTWNGSAVDFYVSQTLYGLPAGNYEVKALVASDLGNTITLAANDEAVGLSMETEKGTGTYTSLIFKLEEAGDVTIKVSSDKWFKADNFTLTYYGTGSEKTPTKVISTLSEINETIEGIYTIDGKKKKKITRGINIIRVVENTNVYKLYSNKNH